MKVRDGGREEGWEDKLRETLQMQTLCDVSPESADLRILGSVCLSGLATVVSKNLSLNIRFIPGLETGKEHLLTGDTTHVSSMYMRYDRVLFLTGLFLQ